MPLFSTLVFGTITWEHFCRSESRRFLVMSSIYFTILHVYPSNQTYHEQTNLVIVFSVFLPLRYGTRVTTIC